MHPDTLVLFAKALVVGVSIAAPVGPIGLLTIQRTLDQGMRAGLATGLGAAAADGVYGALGAFGVKLVVDWLIGARVGLALVGGAVLFWLALRTWRRPVVGQAAALPSSADLARCFAGTFALTLSNPATILSFVAVFGMLAGATSGSASAWPMIAGVVAGSALWWLLLSWSVARWRHRFDARWRARVNRISALILASFASWQWLRLWSG